MLIYELCEPFGVFAGHLVFLHDENHLKYMHLNAKIISLQQSICYFILVFITACTWTDESGSAVQYSDTKRVTVPVGVDTVADAQKRYYAMLADNGFVRLLDYDSSFVVNLKYATADNFTRANLYGFYDDVFLQEEIVRDLCRAQRLLKAIDSGMSLVVFDGARPRSVQYTMWEQVNASGKTKVRFLADPEKISMHNMGLAVDVGIVLQDGSLLDMGTEFDFIGELAYPCLQDYFLEKGLLGYNHVNNRDILSGVMTEAGFNANRYEWWHFSKYTKDYAIANYPVIEDFSSMTNPVRTEKEIRYDKEILFSVQISASKSRLSSNALCVSGAEHYQHDGMYKYFSGTFDDLEIAYRYRDSLRLQGCAGAFIIAFYNGERIPVKEALKKKQF